MNDSKENLLCSLRRVSCNWKYGMHYDDEREGTLFSMPRGAEEWEDAYLGNDKKKLKKGETDPYCMHVNGLLLHVFHRKFWWYVWTHENFLRKHWWLRFDCLHYWTSKQCTCNMCDTVYKYVFYWYAIMPFTNVQAIPWNAFILDWIYLTVTFDAWDLHYRNMHKYVCIRKQYRQITIQRHTLCRNPASGEGFRLHSHIKSCIEILRYTAFLQLSL